MLAPGKIYIGRPNRLTVNYNRDGTDVDPTTVTLRVMTPCGAETSYTYAAAQITKTSAGDYYYDVVPTEAGRWFWRWEATGTDTTDATEGDFLVQDSPFYAWAWASDY